MFGLTFTAVMRVWHPNWDNTRDVSGMTHEQAAVVIAEDITAGASPAGITFFPSVGEAVVDSVTVQMLSGAIMEGEYIGTTLQIEYTPPP